MSWSQVFFVGMVFGCMLLQGVQSTSCADSRGTSSDGVEQLELNCYHWGIRVKVKTKIIEDDYVAFPITSLSYRCTNSAGILVRNDSLVQPGQTSLEDSWDVTIPPGTSCTLLGCYERQDYFEGSEEVYDLETRMCTIPGIVSTTGTQLPEGTPTPHPSTTEGYTGVSMSEVPEGYVPTTSENMEYHSITLGAIQTAALPLSTPPPTLQTTVAMSSHSIPTGSVLPTLVLQHNDAGAVYDGGTTAAIALVVAVAVAVILTSIVTICIMILRYNYRRSNNSHKIYGKDFLGDIDLTFKPVEVNPNYTLIRGESFHSILYTLEKEAKAPIQATPQEPNVDDSDEQSETLSTCEPASEDVSCRSMYTEDRKDSSDKHQEVSIGIKKASTLFSASSYVSDKYTSGNASQNTSSDHTVEICCSSISEHFHFLEEAPVLTSPTSMPCQEPPAQNDGYVQETDPKHDTLTVQRNGYICDPQNTSSDHTVEISYSSSSEHSPTPTSVPCQEPLAQNDGYVQETDAKHDILRSIDQNQHLELNIEPPTSTAQPNGYICDIHALQQNSSYSQHLTVNPAFPYVHNEVMQVPTETIPAVQTNGYCSSHSASPQYSSSAPNPRCESDVLLFCTEYDEAFTLIPSTKQSKAAIKDNQPTDHCSGAYITENHVPHYDTNIQNDNQETNPSNQVSEYFQHPLSQSDPLEMENNLTDFIWCLDSASMSEDTGEMAQSSPGPRAGSQELCSDPQATQEYVLNEPQNDAETGNKMKDVSNADILNHPIATLEPGSVQIRSDIPLPALSPLAVSEKQVDGRVHVPALSVISSDRNIEASTGTYISHTPVQMDTFQAGRECYQEEELPWLDTSMLEQDLQSNHQNPMIACSHSTITELQVEPEMSASADTNLDCVSQSDVQSAEYMDFPAFSAQHAVYLDSHSPNKEEYLIQSGDYTCVYEGGGSEASDYYPTINVTNQQAPTVSQSQTTTRPHDTPLVLPSLHTATNQQNIPSGNAVNSIKDEAVCPSGNTVNSIEDEAVCLLWLEDDASLEQETPNLPFIHPTNVHSTSSYTGMEEMKAPVYPIPSPLSHVQVSLPSEKSETLECQQNQTTEQHSIELDSPPQLDVYISECDRISYAQEVASLSSGYISNSTGYSDYFDGTTMFGGLREEVPPSNQWKANCYTSDYI